MDQDYVESKVREALKNSGGNAARARQQIILWAAEDQRLLLGLTKAHLSGIVSYNIDRVISGRADSGKNEEAAAAAIPAAGNEEADFGMEILKAVAGNNGAQFGFEPSTLGKRQQVSQSHVDALRMMAGKKPIKRS